MIIGIILGLTMPACYEWLGGWEPERGEVMARVFAITAIASPCLGFVGYAIAELLYLKNKDYKNDK